MSTVDTTKPAPLTLASVLPWVRQCFALTTTDVGFTDKPSIVVSAKCRSCKTMVEPTADALAGHECEPARHPVGTGA